MRLSIILINCAMILLNFACSEQKIGESQKPPIDKEWALGMIRGPINLFFPSTPINGVPHAVTIRGRDATLPLLLIIHGGPGYAMIDLFHFRLPELESSFVVVNYDQRGAGLSYSKGLDPSSLTLHQLVEDAHEISRFVLKTLHRSDRNILVLGHSMGTMIGLDLVKKYSGSYASYIGVGQVVNVVENEQVMYDFALAQAEASQNTQAISELHCIGRPLSDLSYPFPMDGAGACDSRSLDPYEVALKWMSFFGGDLFGETSTAKVESDILASNLYANKLDQWLEGLYFSGNLFNDPNVQRWDARTLHIHNEIPLFFFMGRHDFDTPAPLVASYVPLIHGFNKLVWFEKSSHFPFYEEKDEFIRRLLSIADAVTKP